MKEYITQRHIPEELHEHFIKSFETPHQVSVLTPLFYEDHVPTAAIFLLQGEIKMIRKRRQVKVIQAGNLIGLTELIERSPHQSQASALPYSSYLTLDRTTVMEIIGHTNHPLYSLFMSILSSSMVHV